MDIAATKLELLERIMSIRDEKILKRIAVFFKKEVPTASDADDEITGEEYAEFERLKAQRDRGEIEFVNEKDHVAAVRRLTKASKRA